MRKIVGFLFVLMFVFSCSEPEARRPKKHSTTNFYKELIAKNKKLIQQENKFIQAFIQQDTVNVYLSSEKGFWYTYNVKVGNDSLNNPKPEDVVNVEYNITNLDGSVLYPNQQKNYKVDKEDFIPALQDGIKLMKKGETITFVIPSYRGFGIAGDGNKIGINHTIKSRVTLIDINKTNNENN